MMFYNQEAKDRFIKYTKSDQSKARARTLFKRTKLFETALEKDFGDFTQDEACDFLSRSDLGDLSANTVWVLLAVLRSYTLWYKKEQGEEDPESQLPRMSRCLNLVYHIDDEGDEGFISREDLLENLKYFGNVRDRAITLGLFEGIKGEHFFDEFVEIKDSDSLREHAEDDGKTTYGVYLNDRGKEVEISHELYDYIVRAMSVTQLAYPNTAPTSYKDVKADYGLVKLSAETQNPSRAAYTAFVKMLKNIPALKDISIKRLMECGIIDFVNQKVRETKDHPQYILFAYKNEIKSKFPYYRYIPRRFYQANKGHFIEN